MGYSLRDYIDLMREHGELFEINEEVDWRYEAFAFSLLTHRVNGPCLLFNKIKGVKEGYRLMTGYFAGSYQKPGRRIAIILGMDPDADASEVMAELLRRMGTPLKPVEVASGPVKEVVKIGEDVNLFEYPFVLMSEGDGGRYALTNNTIVKDPDSDWTNWGNYAICIHSRNRISNNVQASSNFAAIYAAKYEARGESMPLAICIGGDPVTYMAAAAGMPAGVSEADIAGGFRRAPMELVKCETSDLLVPADAEMIIEGECRPGAEGRLPEGPKPDAYGYVAGPRQIQYGFRIHAVTHRKDIIMPFLATAMVSEVQSQNMIMISAGETMGLKMLGLPVKQVVWWQRAWPTYFASIDTSKAYPGYIRDINDKMVTYPLDPITLSYQYVDPEVNPTRYDQCIEALFTQPNPARDVWRTPNRAASTCGVCFLFWEPEDRDRYWDRSTMPVGRYFVDGTTKGEPPLGVKRLSFESVFPDATQQWVIDNWERLGFEKEGLYWNKPYEKMV